MQAAVCKQTGKANLQGLMEGTLSSQSSCPTPWEPGVVAYKCDASTWEAARAGAHTGYMMSLLATWATCLRDLKTKQQLRYVTLTNFTAYYGATVMKTLTNR